MWTILFALCAPISTDLYYETYTEILSEYPKFKDLEIKDTCLTNIAPLSFIFEFETDDGRKSICIQQPWRTNRWIIDECDEICKETEIDV